MKSLGDMLTNSTFQAPELTPEQWAERNAEVEEWERERRAAKLAARMQSASIPAAYARASGAHPKVLEWAERPTKGLLLQGKVGRGKTHNACIALRKAIEGGTTAKFATFDDLLRECKATFKNSDTEEAVIARYTGVGMLCIDDMGKERVTEWSLPIIFAIVNKRGMALRPTIVTTQYTGRQLVERLTVNGDAETARAIISRFMEYTRVTIEGKDWRRGDE